MQYLPFNSLALFFILTCATSASAAAKKPAAPSPAGIEFFESKIRPILVNHCMSCHGEKKQKGSLRLDSRAAALEGGDKGPAIVPGHPEKSLLIVSVLQEAKLKMPRDADKLTRAQIADLTQWVRMGAPWPGSDKAVVARKGEMVITDKDRGHWSFQPIKRPALPEVKDATWGKNPIDAFVLAGLEAKDLSPNPPASKQELVRRLNYNLTGLPPSPKDVETFQADKSPRAYEDLIDRLLESPHYGEKWARHWLDLVRFAETNSYERDNPKPNAWRYRDYVIRAFNADKPYDVFLKEQLAGDEMGGKDPEPIIATGYYRLGIWDDEPSDRIQARYDGLDDIIATTGQVFLGLTLDCARCHNHKIDPIPQKDYYRFLSFFHNINHFKNGGDTDEYPILTAAARADYERKMRELDDKRNRIQADITAIEKDFRTALEKKSAPVAVHDLDDLTYRFYRDSWNKLPDFGSLKPEETGKLPNRLFDISPRTRNEAFGFVFEGVLIVPAAGKYTFYLDSDDGSRLTIDGKKLLEYDGIHGLGNEKKVSVNLAKGRLPIKLEYFQNVFGLGLVVAWSGPGFERRLLSAPLEGKTLGSAFNKLIVAEGPRVLGQARFDTYQKLKKELAGLKKVTVPAEKALCVTEAGSTAPETHVHNRGNPHTKGDKVEPGFLTVLNIPEPMIPSPKSGAKSTGRRTVLAKWIASKDNPLTARVMANRIWQNHFGRGIVRTPNDFGLQGMRPTHPELLDWLAAEFIARGWSMKQMHRLILTSNAFKMSSRGNDKGLAADPANDRFWRHDMRRLSAEEIRDSILVVSGNFNAKMFGPSIYPEIPKEVLAGQSVPGRGWGKSSPEEAARRSIYIHVKRSLLYPILETFDLAEPDRTTAVRFSSTQPTQALAMLNSDMMQKQAAIFAQRLKREAGADVAKQVRLALTLATSRQPSDGEVRRGVDLIQALQKEDRVSAEVALNSFCLVVLNLNEFVYLD